MVDKMKQVVTTVIVPAYNEEDGLRIVLEKIFQTVDDSYEVIVVDDGSDDRTSVVASKFPCTIIRHKSNKGKGEALRSGIERAHGEKVIWIDADDTYPVELIPKMAESLMTYDLVACSRRFEERNIPRFNRIGNAVFRYMIRTMYGFEPHDPCSGLYGVKKRYLKAMKLSAKGFAIEPEISIKGSRMKLKMLGIPIVYRARVGDSKLNCVKVGFEDLWCILRLIPWRPSKDG